MKRILNAIRHNRAAKLRAERKAANRKAIARTLGRI